MKYCSYCGKEINERANFCKYCGKFLNNNLINTKNSNNYLFAVITLILILAIIFTTTYVLKQNNVAKENNYQGQIEQNSPRESVTKIKQQNKVYENKKLSYPEILKHLENYQAQYWQIIKRNNLLIDQGMEEDEAIEKDQKDLSNLFKMVENNIDKDNQYYKKLEIIEKQFENNNGETQYDMNNFAGIYNDTIDGLLNDVYKNIKATIPESDFTNLKMSERKWLKDIESYKVVMNSEDLGSMGGMTKAYAIANMRKFRILLLLLYYN